jgi:prepilin-type N-terminal cleavage/methylation domain-containing protein
MRKIKGFTMIELLIVIAVLGILAVAVLAAINPIEQINRSKDTGTRSDCEQLLSGIDRFYASKGYYPWQNAPDDGRADALNSLTNVKTLNGVLNNLVTATGELKEAFKTKITANDYNTIYLYNRGKQGDSTYACFIPKSKAFLDEAAARCSSGMPDDFEANCNAGGGNWYSCLP